MVAGLCCSLSCTIGLIGDCLVQCGGIKAEQGRRRWQAGAGGYGGDDHTEAIGATALSQKLGKYHVGGGILTAPAARCSTTTKIMTNKYTHLSQA